MIKEEDFYNQQKHQNKQFAITEQDKRILNQSSIKALNIIHKQLGQSKKIFLNVIGLNKNGKSVLCNQLVDFQFEDQKNQTVQYIFPSHNDPMTTGKIHFQTKFLVDEGQLFYLKKQFKRQLRASLQRPSQETFFYQTINETPGDIYKQEFKVTNIKGDILSSFRHEHALWRQRQKQLQDLTMRRKSSKIIAQTESMPNIAEQSLKTLNYFFQMIRWIQNDFALSKYAVVVDHPGLNQYYQKTLSSKMNEINTNKQQKNQQKQLKSQCQIIDAEDDYVPKVMNELKFKESELIIYCSSHVSGLFNFDHEQNIRKLFQQNNSDQILLAFCFIRSVQAGKFQRIKTQISVYKNIFDIIPSKTLEILKKIIYEAQKSIQYKNFIGASKIQKITKIRDQLIKYLTYKNNYYQKVQYPYQIDSMSFFEKQQKKDRFFYSKEETIRDLLKLYPCRSFHFYGLRQEELTSSIKSMQYIDQICKENLKSTLKLKIQKIFSKGFNQMEEFFKVVQRQIDIQAKKINLSDIKKNAIQEFYMKIRSSFLRFQDLYFKLQIEYSLKVQQQFSDIRKMYEKMIDKNSQRQLKGKFRLSILLQKQIIDGIVTCFNKATVNISKQLQKFKKQYNQFVWSEFEEFLKMFKKLLQSLMSMVYNKQKSQQKEITQQIVTNYKKFLTTQLFQDISKKINEWNQFLEYNQKSFEVTTLNLNFYKIMSFKQAEEHFNISKESTQNFWSKFMIPIYGTVNHLKIIFQKQTDSKYYDQEWNILREAIQESIQASKLIKMNSFNFDKIVQRAEQQYIYKNKSVQKLSSIYELWQKVHNLKKDLLQKKQKIMLILFPG